MCTQLSNFLLIVFEPKPFRYICRSQNLNMKKYLLALFILASFQKLNAQTVIPIGTAKVMAVGSIVTIRGIITNGSEMGTIRYIQDGTGGMALYSSTLNNTQRGDSIEATGTLKVYNNLMEMDPVSSYTLISTGNPMPAPFVLTMASGYIEAYEGRLVRFNNSHFISTGTFAGNTNYTATDNSLVSAQVRTNISSDIVGLPIPVGNIDLVGIMSQNISTYQLLVRDKADLVVAGAPPVFTTTILQKNITTTSFDVSFSTQNAGNTIIQYGTTTALGSEITDATLVTEHSASLSGLNATTLYYLKAITIGATGDTSYSSLTPMYTQSLSSGTIKCYFTRPVDISVAQGANAISLPQIADDTLIAYMNRAKYTMDVAIYNLDNDNGIIDAINAAYNRGVSVRVVGNGDISSSVWNLIIIPSSNKKLSPTSAEFGIMHNKFIAIDAYSPDPNDAIVWTGSMNFTDQQVNSDANNMIIFQDQSLAGAYEIEFNEMFGGTFGPNKTNNTPKEFNIGGNRVELYFSPSDDTESQINRTAESADHDLELCVFSYTRYYISYSIDERTSAGVWGGGIVDDTSSGSYAYSILLEHMPNSLYVASNSWIVHHKYLLVDANAPGLDPIVLTGSHNWSTSAQTKNDENTVIVHNAEIANQYYQEWVARYHDEGGVELPTYLVGINDPQSIYSPVTVFPNPATDHVNVVMNSSSSINGTVSIVDVTGKILEKKTVEMHEGSNLISVDVSAFTNGIYMLRVQQGSNVAASKILVSK